MGLSVYMILLITWSCSNDIIFHKVLYRNWKDFVSRCGISYTGCCDRHSDILYIKPNYLYFFKKNVCPIFSEIKPKLYWIIRRQWILRYISLNFTISLKLFFISDHSSSVNSFLTSVSSPDKSSIPKNAGLANQVLKCKL